MAGWKHKKTPIIVGNESNPTKMESGQVIINKKATKQNLNKLIEINNDGLDSEKSEVTTDGTDGGLLKGKPHYDKNGNPLGGIPVVVDGGKKIEVEGDEFVINKEASKKHWKELSRINQSAGNGVPINPSDVGADDDPEEFRQGGKIIEFNPNHLPKKVIYNYAKMVKEKYPKVWDLGGNIFGNEAFRNLERALKRGYWTDNEEWMYIKWRSYVARHKQDFRIAGVIAMLKWVDVVDRGWDYMKDLIEKEIAKRYPKKKTGGAVTYKQKYNKKYNYDSNETHDLSEVAKDTRVSKKGLQQIYNKGIGAYKTNPESVRPNVKSKEQWAMGRVYSAVMGGKAAKIDANELRMDIGGATSWEKMISASSRFRPYETIAFEPPLVGENGAKLISYTWAYEMTMQPNWEGELVGKRVSDWTQAEISAETGRGIVHRYTVELPDGSVKVVSSESVPILMGYVDRTQAKVFGNLATASKTLAKQQMALAIMEAKYKEYLDAIQSVKDKGFPEPHVEKSESLSGYKLFVGDGSCYINENGTYDRERLDCAKNNYINNRLKEMGIDVYSANRSSAIYDLKNRIARQKRKVEQMLKTSNMEVGGNIENSDLTEITLNRVYSGEINSDDAAIELDESGIEVDHDLYERLRDAEKSFLNKNRGLQVGDTITVKGKHGNSDFKGNFRGFTNEGKLVVVYGGGNQMVIGKDDYYENGGTTDDFDWESLFNPSEEEQEKIKQEIKKSEEQEKEDWYQNSRFSKKWAATYQDAVNRTVKEYLDAKATYEDWGSRQYKSNKGVVYAGGDDIHGTAYTIGGINEYRRKKTMDGAKMLMDESIETLKDLGLTDEEISNLLQNKMAKGGNLYHLGGDMSKHLAPNGNPSNLTHEQWHLVRTPEFKAWFGDWENDPANASKILDENKEPLVVYHGTDKDFTIFDKSRAGELETIKTVDRKIGIYFSNKKGIASFYTKNKGKILECFLNVRKPLKASKLELSTFEIEFFKEAGDDGIIWNRGTGMYINGKPVPLSRGEKPEIEYIVFEPNQIKLANGTNTTFDSKNPDIRFNDGGNLDDLIY
jgi:hypothetical protein